MSSYFNQQASSYQQNSSSQSFAVSSQVSSWRNYESRNFVGPNHHQIYTQEVILISRSSEIIQSLQSIIHSVVQSIEDLPLHSDIKAAILDTEYARLADISWIRKTYPTSFIAVYDPSASERACHRASCFDAGANMVAHDIESLLRTIEEAVIPAGSQGGSLVCPYCSLRNLSENEMWYHCPAYHINWPNEVPVTNNCPICRETLHEPLQVHIHEAHAPRPESSPQTQVKLSTNQVFSPNSFRPVTPRVNQLYNFSLVICRHPVTGKFLLCQEFANQGFWCPGGAVDPGETLSIAAKRETLEEAGIDVELKGILGIEYNPVGISRRNQNFIVRLRVIFYAEPSLDKGINQLPKSSPDYESAGACWCSYEEIQMSIKLRGGEPKKWTKYLAEGGMIYPLGLLQEKTG